MPVIPPCAPVAAMREAASASVVQATDFKIVSNDFIVPYAKETHRSGIVHKRKNETLQSTRACRRDNGASNTLADISSSADGLPFSARGSSRDRCGRGVALLCIKSILWYDIRSDQLIEIVWVFTYAR